MRRKTKKKIDDFVTCKDCKGEGGVASEQCKTCRGWGRIRASKAKKLGWL